MIRDWNAQAQAVFGHAPGLLAAHWRGGKRYVELAFGIVRDASGTVLGAAATGHLPRS